MAREDFRLVHSMRVRWAEVDPQKVVFNANYLMYFDVAVTEYWREVGPTYPEGFLELGIDTFAVKATIEFHRSARFDDVIDVCLRVARIGNTSLRVVGEIHRGDEHLVTAEIVYVVIDAETQKPSSIPGPFRDAIVAYEKLPPEASGSA